MTGILDEYPGASAAYSLRLLNTDYTGDAVIVRRASDNTTQSIGFVDGELDTTTLDTFCSGTDGFVTKWYDQSGNTYDAVQTTASNQPKIYDSVNGVIEVNGKPAISFDGVNNFLNASTLNVPQPTSYFITYKYNDYTSSQKTDLSDGVTSRQLIDGEPNGNIRIFAGTSFVSTIQGLNNQALRFSLFNGTNSAIALNGGTAQIGDAGVNAINNMNIGKSISFLDGYIQEFIIYPADESSNRTGIETNINNYYNIY